MNTMFNYFADKVEFSFILSSRLVFQQRPENPPEQSEEKQKPEGATPNEPNVVQKTGHEIVDKEAQAIKRLQFQLLKDEIEQVDRQVKALPKNATLEEFSKADRKLILIMFRITDKLGINFKDEFLARAKTENLELAGGDWNIKVDGDNIVITRRADFISKKDAQRPLATSTGLPVPALERPLGKPRLTINIELKVRPDFTFTRSEDWKRNAPEEF